MAEPPPASISSPPSSTTPSFAPRLAEACATGAVAAVLLRLAPADERGLINQVKALAPAAQEHGAAVIVASEAKADLANVAARGGADGVHVAGDPARLRELRERLKSRARPRRRRHPHARTTP